MRNKEWENDQILEKSVQYFKERGQFKWTEDRERKEQEYRQADLLSRMVTCMYWLQVPDHVTHVRAADTLSWVELSSLIIQYLECSFFPNICVGQLSLYLELDAKTAYQSCLPRPPSGNSFTLSSFILQ